MLGLLYIIIMVTNFGYGVVMLSVDLQLKQAYEEGGLTPEQIAEHENLDIIAVKAKLMQVSPKYRDDSKGELAKQNNFDESEQELAKKVIIESMLCAERSDGTVDHKTRLDAAKYIRDDAKGRLDNKGIKAPQFNMLQFNQALINTRDKAMQAIGNAVNGKAIEV
jgi:hypothetical protein